MAQRTTYFDALSKYMYPQQDDVAPTLLSSESQPPSLSASPVSSEGSDSLIDETPYGLFYDHPPTAIYSSYDQNYASMLAGSTAVNDHSFGAAAKNQYSFGYESSMMFDRNLAHSAPTYQPSFGYTPQERNPLAFNYPVHSDTVSGLSTMLVDSAPFATVAPSDTSGLYEDDSAYKLSAGVEGLSISSPVSSPFFYAESVGSSPPLLSMPEPQPTKACDPRVLGSPVAMEQLVIRPGSYIGMEAPRRAKAASTHAPIVDSDYSPSGESEVEDNNDHDYGLPLNRKKNRYARVSSAAHPYLKPAKAKGKKNRGTTLEIPIPVPGLTRNSRGRGVPQKKKGEVILKNGTRAFWCSVENCNKLFRRGEHLKRHITSIHTYDRRFRCKCTGIFSRRDNLFQHMRAKGCVVWFMDEVQQVPDPDEPQKSEKSEKSEKKQKHEKADPSVAQIMADAEIAQEKRDRVWKQARAQH